ncbi:MAG: YciI family protein [Ilumatobacteraceae bacterium]
MKYLILLYAAPDARPVPGTPESAAEHQAWMTYTMDMIQAGVHRGGDALHGIETATTIREVGGSLASTDGPFAETKETLGGYYLIDVPDLDTALEWAGRAPIVKYGAAEVRPLMVFDDIPSTAGA